MNGIWPYPPSFLENQKESDKSATVEAGTFYGILPWGLTSFVTERSKQERCHRFDAVDADQGKPLDPAQRETIKCNFYRLLPGPPCGPGVQVFPQRKNGIDRANGLQRESVTLPQAAATFHPACKVRPGADGGEMACRLSMAGVQRGRPSGRRPPVRKGGAFLGSSFGDERRIALRQTAGHLPPKEE